MSEFFRTRMGQVFFEGTMPRLYRAIDRLTDALDGRREYRILHVDRVDHWEGDLLEVQQQMNQLSKQGFRYRETLSHGEQSITLLMERAGDRVVRQEKDEPQ